jgi:hypothetical protein
VKRLLAILLFVAPLAHAAELDVEALGAWTALPGAGHIGETAAHLRPEPRLGAGVAMTARLSEHYEASVGGSMALLPVSLRSPGEKDHGRVIRVVPLSASLLADVFTAERWTPYLGGGIFLPLVRHAVDPAEVSVLHIKRIEQPDHGAILLEGGVRYAAARRWSLVGDVKFDPVWSTLEVQARELRRTQQTNFHPLIVSTGIAARF